MDTFINERRKAKRYPQQLDAIIDSPECIQVKQVENVSQSGFFINTVYTVEKDSGIQFRVILPGEVEPHEISILGKVAYSLDMESANLIGSMPGIGVRLEEFPHEGDEQKFLKFIAHLENTEA